MVFLGVIPKTAVTPDATQIAPRKCRRIRESFVEVMVDQNPSLHRDSDKDRSGYTSGGFSRDRGCHPVQDLDSVVRADRLPPFKFYQKNIGRLATLSGLGDDPKRSPWFFVSPLNKSVQKTPILQVRTDG